MSRSSGRSVIPPALRPRLEIAGALARERITEVHFRYTMELIDHAASEVDPSRALEIYTRLHNLRGPDASTLSHKVFVALGRRTKSKGQAGASDDATRAPTTPLSIFGQIRRRLRGRVNADLRTWVEYHTGRAETELLWTHVENALQFADLLEPNLPIGAAVTLYGDEIGLPPGRTEMVYYLALAGRTARQLAAEPSDATEIEPSTEPRADRVLPPLRIETMRRGPRRRRAG